MMNYTAKTPTIVNYTLTLSNTWYQIISENKAIRRWRMKAREATDNSFDFDFTSAHTTYMTNSGAGASYEGCALPDIYSRSATAGTIIELEYWS